MNSMIEVGKVDKEMFFKRMDAIENASKTGSGLIKQLMVFSRQRKLRAETVDVGEVIEGLQDLLQRTLGDEIEIDVWYADDLHYVDLDIGQLEHALINMAVNARDAMSTGGAFKVVADNAVLSDKRAHDLGLAAGDYIRVEVSDTGIGMNEDVVQQIFLPFFSSKGPSTAGGLGLSMVAGFMKQSCGAVDVISREGRGSVFSLFFPKSAQEVGNDEVTKPSVVNDAPEQDIVLVVEDEREILEIAVAILEMEGYQTISAVSGDEAIEIIEQRGDEIDMVFTDIIMPGALNGVQMVSRARLFKPDIKVLFTSGFVANTFADMTLAKKYAMLEKPYKAEQLLQEVARVLEG